MNATVNWWQLPIRMGLFQAKLPPIKQTRQLLSKEIDHRKFELALMCCSHVTLGVRLQEVREILFLFL